MTREERLEKVLSTLLTGLKVYNESDMLDGYLDPILELVEEDLKELEIPAQKEELVKKLQKEIEYCIEMEQDQDHIDWVKGILIKVEAGEEITDSNEKEYVEDVLEGFYSYES